MIIDLGTVQSWFSDILFSDKSRFSDSFAEDHFFTEIDQCEMQTWFYVQLDQKILDGL